MHLGDIADAEGTVTHADGELANLFDAVEAPAHPQLQALAGCFEEAGGAHRVLLLQGLLHRLQWHAKGGQLEVGELDPDFLVLQADQLDLAHILDPLQLDLDAIGVILEQRVVEALTGQRIDITEVVPNSSLKNGPWISGGKV